MAVNYNQMSNKKNTLIVYELITVVLTGTAVAFQKYFFSSLSSLNFWAAMISGDFPRYANPSP